MWRRYTCVFKGARYGDKGTLWDTMSAECYIPPGLNVETPFEEDWKDGRLEDWGPLDHTAFENVYIML